MVAEAVTVGTDKNADASAPANKIYNLMGTPLGYEKLISASKFHSLKVGQSIFIFWTLIKSAASQSLPVALRVEGCATVSYLDVAEN